MGFDRGNVFFFFAFVILVSIADEKVPCSASALMPVFYLRLVEVEELSCGITFCFHDIHIFLNYDFVFVSFLSYSKSVFIPSCSSSCSSSFSISLVYSFFRFIPHHLKKRFCTPTPSTTR